MAGEAGGTGSVGSIHVEVGANTTGFNAGMDQAAAKAQQTANTVEASATKMEAAVDRTGRSAQAASRVVTQANTAAASSHTQTAASVEASIGKQVSAFTALVGRATAVISVFTTFFKIGQSIGGLFQDLTDKAVLFGASLEASNPTAAIDQLDKRLAELHSRYEAASSTVMGFLGNIALEGELPRGIRQQIEELNKQRAGFAEQIRAQQARAAEAKEAEGIADRRKSLDEQVHAAGMGLLGERERAEQEFLERINALSDQYGQETDAGNRNRIQTLIGLIERAREKQRQDDAAEDAKKAAAERKQQEEEVLRVMRQQTAELRRQIDALDALQDRQAGGFGFGALGADTGRIEALLQQIAGNIR